MPMLYDICDDNTPDGFATFDLTTLTGDITAGGNSNVVYYASQADADADVNALPDMFVNTSNPQTIVARVTDATTGCFAFTTADLEVIPAPVAGTSQDYVVCDDDSNDGSATFDLTADQASIENGQMGITVSYFTSQADADANSNAITNAGAYNNTVSPQSIFVRVENATGCFNTSSFTLTVNPLPESVLLDEYTICVDDTGALVITDNSPVTLDTGLTVAGGYSFAWDLNGVALPDTTGAIIGDQVGTYSVTITDDATGCIATDMTQVVPLGPPTDFGASVVTPYFSEQHDIVAFANGPSNYIFALNDGPFIESGVFEDVQPGDYIVTIQDVDGCATVTVALEVIGFPKFFTPNADGFHDTWNIQGLNNESTTFIYIFDRFGKLIKQLDPNGPGWDGTYNGAPLPSSDYWFTLEYVENGANKTLGGHFALKR